MTRLATIGETLALVAGRDAGPLRYARSLMLSIAGAESNVAIGARRLGTSTAWIGRVGADELGELVLTRLRGEDVDVEGVIRDPDAPTGLMLKERRTSVTTRVTYYRRGSAGSRLEPADLDEASLRAAAIVHITGITPALSRSARATVEAAIGVARAASRQVSLDINYRSALWAPDEARPVLLELVRRSDIVFAGEDEAALLVAAGTPAGVAMELAKLGPRTVVIKRGADPSLALVDGRLVTQDACEVPIVDPVGAGDAFAAGFLSDTLLGRAPAACLATAAVCAAFSVGADGDWEGLPSRGELEALRGSSGAVQR